MQVFPEHKRFDVYDCMLFNHSCYFFILATFQMFGGGGSSFIFNEAKDLFDDMIKT